MIPQKHQGIRLRSEPLTISDNESMKVFKLCKNCKPLTYIQNNYENHVEVIFDKITGLMWQKSGSDNYIYYEDIQAYINKINREKLAGYSNWRLPTVDELISLLEPDEKNGDLYIDPVFDKTQRWCWTSDKYGSSGAWYVDFDYGYVYWDYLTGNGWVRLVRP